MYIVEDANENIIDEKWISIKSLELGNIPKTKGTPDKYYLIKKDEEPYLLLKTYYDRWGFEENIIWEDHIAIGFSNYFYLINLEDNNICCIDFEDQYFGHIYEDDQFIWISSMMDLVCMNKKGEIVWRINKLAVDGIIINDYDGRNLSVDCEMDPPGGWVSYVIDNQIGKIIF